MSRFEYTIKKIRITEDKPFSVAPDGMRIIHLLDWDIVSESDSGIFTYELTVVLERDDMLARLSAEWYSDL